MKKESKITNDVAKRLRKIRAELDIRQNELADKLGVAKPTISDIENGKYNPNFEIVSGLVEIYNVNPYYLFFGKGEMFAKHMEFFTSEFEEERSKDIITEAGFRRFLKDMKRSPYLLLAVLSHYHFILARDGAIITRQFNDFDYKYSRNPDPEDKKVKAKK